MKKEKVAVYYFGKDKVVIYKRGSVFEYYFSFDGNKQEFVFGCADLFPYGHIEKLYFDGYFIG